MRKLQATCATGQPSSALVGRGRSLAGCESARLWTRLPVQCVAARPSNPGVRMKPYAEARAAIDALRDVKRAE